MPQRNDTILHDIISEGNGGSAYHNFNLAIFDGVADPAANVYETSWIAPRPVRVINDRALATQVLGGAAVNTMDVFRNIGAGTDRTVITQFDPDTLVADTPSNRALSTAASDGLPNVVANQYDFYVMNITLAIGATGPFNVSFLAHYSFEDL